MFCPECGSEYRAGFIRCSDCDADLVETLSAATNEDEDLVNVFETDNPALMPIIESLLRGEGIEFMKEGATSMPELFAWGRAGAGLFSALGRVRYYVRREHAADAEAVLSRMNV